MVGGRQDHVGAVQPLDQLDLAVEQDVEVSAGSSWQYTSRRGVVFDGAVRDQPVQLFVSEALEEEAAAQLLLERRLVRSQQLQVAMNERDRHGPFADRRRHPLDGLPRTSPAAKIPGTLVSRK